MLLPIHVFSSFAHGLLPFGFRNLRLRMVLCISLTKSSIFHIFYLPSFISIRCLKVAPFIFAIAF
jgi:hypothetical protein